VKVRILREAAQRFTLERATLGRSRASCDAPG
jgi:hypothetical protein